MNDYRNLAAAVNEAEGRLNDRDLRGNTVELPPLQYELAKSEGDMLLGLRVKRGEAARVVTHERFGPQHESITLPEPAAR